MRQCGARGGRRGRARHLPARVGAPATGQARPACAPEKTLAVKLTSEERALPAPLIATHDVSVAAEFTGTTERETYAPPPGVKVLATGRSGVDFIVPIAASVAITVSWQQAIDPSDPRPTRATPLTSCAALDRRDAPDRAGPSQPRGEAARVDRRVAAGLLVVRRRAGPQAARPLTAADLGPHDLARGLPAATAAARTMAVPMRTVDQIKYAKKLPDPFRIGVAGRCRLYLLTCGAVFSEVARPFLDTDALQRGVEKADINDGVSCSPAPNRALRPPATA